MSKMEGSKYWISLLVAGCLMTGSQEKEAKCCSSILFDSVAEDHQVVGNRLGFYQQFGQYGARPAYK